MSSEHQNPPSSWSQGKGFRTVDAISAQDKSLNDISSAILHHEEAGLPLVIRGLNADPNWSPPPVSDPPQDHGFGELQPPVDDAEDAFVWAHRLSLIPKDLLPTGPREVSSVKADRGGDMENEGVNRSGGRPLGQNHCASTFHWLTLDLTEAGSDVWFIVEASRVRQMEAQIFAESGPIFMTESELSSSPFQVFQHFQSAGDLLVIPPRCYAQNLREGHSTSVSWSRMSVHGLGLAFYSELPMYRRLCRPEVCNVRKAIYTSMKSHASGIKQSLTGSSPTPSDSHPNTSHSIPRMAGELQELIRLFDDVLLEGYSDDHDSLFLPDHMACDPTCHYCGASLFLSYFSCTGMCFDLETDSPRVDMSIRVCGACYVEGRSCACKDMNPRRLQNFSDALRERNDAARTLSEYSTSHSASVDNLCEISEKDFSWPRIAVFQAAKELWKLRNATDTERRGRTCTPRGGQRSHAMPSDALVNCKKCHAAKCFSHILDGSVHSSEALLAISADSSGAVWHQLHKTARRRDVPSHWTQGQSVGLAGQLVFFASNFSSTSAVNGETSVGFYDGHHSRAFTGLESTREAEEGSDTSFRVLSSAQATSSRASSRSTTVPHSDEETPGHSPATIGRASRHSTGYNETNADTSRPRSKRPRNTESQDEQEYPSKRIRLRRSSLKTLRAASSQSLVISEGVVTQKTPQLQSPVTLQSGGVQDQMIEPTDKPVASTSIIVQATSQGRSTTAESDRQPIASTSKNDRTNTLQRKPKRAGSSNSLGSTLVSTTSVSQPLAFNFFNPATDLRRGESSVASSPRTANAGILTRATQPLRRSDFPFRRAPSLSLPTLNPLAPPPLFQTHFSTTNLGVPSTPFNRVAGEYVRPAGASRYLAADDISREIQGRRDSHEDLDAQRALGAMEGDSLSKKNIQGYIELLRASGAFDTPT